MKKVLRNFVLSAIMALSFCLLGQNAGSVDLSFADNGKLTIDNGFLDLFQDVEIQADQKIVAIGNSYDAMWTAIAKVYRFMPDGSPDLSFATNGVFSYSLNNEANLYDCVIRDNGKILMTGSTTDYNDYRLLLIQLNENGIPDVNFGDNGIVVQKIGPDMNFFEDHSYAITLQDDGKILVAGKSYNENFQFVPVVVRFTEEGQLDTSFGNNGVAGIAVTEVENDFDCLLVQDDEKIVAAGHYANTFLSFAMLVVRFMPDGTPDPTFGTNGIVNLPYSGVDDEGFDIALTSDNCYLVAGFTATASYNFSLLMMKFDQQGNLVAGFGNNGIVVVDLGQYDIGYKIFIQSDDRIIVAGTTGELPPMDCDMAVWRFHPDGTADNSFGNGGMAKIQWFGNVDEGLAMAHQPDGKLVIAGKARTDTNFDFAMVRLLNDFSTSITENKAASVLVSPNPASTESTLTISYNLPVNGNFRAVIFNSMGTALYSVELGYQVAGINSAVFSIPSGTKKGIYFIRIEGDGFYGVSSKLVVIP